MSYWVSRRDTSAGRRIYTGQLRFLTGLASLALVVACLYWARVILIPIALALLLAFLLSPVVGALQRVGLGRVAPVVLVVSLAVALLGGVGWITLVQLGNLAHELPTYRANIRQKIADLRGAGKGTVLEKFQETAKEIQREVEKPAPGEAPNQKPIPVVVQTPSVLWRLPSLFEALGTAGLVIVLVIFMLLRRQDLRDRLIRLMGDGRLTTTTRALDDAGHRISRYLLMQSIINGTFGLALGLGLFLIGVPYAFLWGFLGAALRFIPYVGPWIAAILPIALSAAAFPGWVRPALALGLVLTLELVSNMVLEPWLYGQSAGASDVGLLVAVAFWTWLWGPIGLVLATPLTVCFVVFSKHVAEFEILGVLMGDEPAMAPSIRYYQRLLAMNQDEATEVVDEYLKTNALEDLHDQVLIPALVCMKRDRRRGRLTEEEEQFIVQATRRTIEDLGEREAEASTLSAERLEVPDHGDAATSLAKAPVLGCPVVDQMDELALLMFRQLLDPTRCDVALAAPQMLASEIVSLVDQHGVAVVCLGALPPDGLAQARYLCKRLRARFPDLKIVVGRWGYEGNLASDRDLLRAAGAEHVGANLRETGDAIMPLIQLAASSLARDAGAARALTDA